MMEGKGGSRGRDICIHIADSLHCTAETNTTLSSNYPLFKSKYLFLKTLCDDHDPSQGSELWGQEIGHMK